MKIVAWLRKAFFQSVDKMRDPRISVKPRHRHWEELSPTELEHVGFGHHFYGFGVYRFDPKTYEILEWWPDFSFSRPDEIKRYEQWCEANGLEPIRERRK